MSTQPGPKTARSKRLSPGLKSSAVLTFFIFTCLKVTNVSTADGIYFKADRNSSALKGFCTYAAPS